MSPLADELDWEKVYEQYEPMVRGVVRDILLRDDEDLVQGVFGDAYESGLNKPIEDIGAFLRNIAHDVAVDQLRHWSNEESGQAVVERATATITAPDSGPFLEEALSELTARERGCFLGYSETNPPPSHEELAEQLQCSIQASKDRLCRARKKLRRHFTDL